MRITKSNQRSKPSQPRSLVSQAGPDALLLIGLLALAAGLGYAAHALGWQRSLMRLGRMMVQHPRTTLVSWYHQNTVPVLYVDLPFVNYETLTQAREQALRLGAYVPQTQDHVAAIMRYEGTEVPVEVWPLAGPTDAFQAVAWQLSFYAEVSPLLSMTRFNLTPADSAYVSTWGYLETLRRLEIPTVQSRLVRLNINGVDEGLYVLEKVPTPSMVTPGQLVVGFDATAYWSTVTQLGETVPESGFQYADTVVFGASEDPAVIRDEALRRLYAVQSGELAPADAFDVATLARFMAITTFWRGTPAVDWRTVRWAYDPGSRRFIPIARGYHPEPLKPLPEVFTDDPVIQIAYARALREFSQSGYLDALERALGPEMEDLRWRMGVDLTRDPLPWSTLETHQRLMRAQLSPSRPVSAYFIEGAGGLWLGLANLQQLPVEIVGVNVGEHAFVAANSAWVMAEDRGLMLDDEAGVTLRGLDGPVPRFLHLHIPFDVLDGPREGAVHVTVRIAGLPSQEIDVETTYDNAGVHFHALEARP